MKICIEPKGYVPDESKNEDAKSIRLFDPWMTNDSRTIKIFSV